MMFGVVLYSVINVGSLQDAGLGKYVVQLVTCCRLKIFNCRDQKLVILNSLFKNILPSLKSCLNLPIKTCKWYIPYLQVLCVYRVRRMRHFACATCLNTYAYYTISSYSNLYSCMHIH